MNSRFARLVNAKEQATREESQLSTSPDSTQATNIPSALSALPDSSQAAISEREHSTAQDNQLATNTAREQSEEVDIHNPPHSPITTNVPEIVSKPATRRKPDSHRRRPVDSRQGDRHKTDRIPFNNRLSAQTVERIKHFCIDEGMEQQEFAEFSAIHFMDFVESQQSLSVDSKQALDDRRKMILFKSNPLIINLYQKYNPDNRWKPADDYEGIRYNDVDIRIVEIGIIHTQFNARFRKVHSFKYYTTEIDVMLETPLASETLDIMLKSARRRWAEAGQG